MSRLTVRPGICVLLIALLSVGCAPAPQTKVPADPGFSDEIQSPVAWQAELGDEDYLGDMVALAYMTDEEGLTGIRHRKVRDLGAFTGKTEVGIVMAFYDPLAEHAPPVIAEMERLAEQHPEDLAVLLIAPEAEDPFLKMFDRQLLPCFYMVKGGEIRNSVKGIDEENLQKLKDFASE
jgi:hypothetical protein